MQILLEFLNFDTLKSVFLILTKSIYIVILWVYILLWLGVVKSDGGGGGVLVDWIVWWYNGVISKSLQFITDH